MQKLFFFKLFGGICMSAKEALSTWSLYYNIILYLSTWSLYFNIVPYLLRWNKGAPFSCLCTSLGVDVWCEDLMARSTLALSHINTDIMDCCWGEGCD
jgi:hypothetical protein